jgi:caffeoyl-CoA O-methyltransferase
MEMTPQRWRNTNAYISDVFGREDEQLRTLMPRAVEAGLPDIAVSAGVGRMLQCLVATAREGKPAQCVVELGTLAGYSGIWLARALAPGGMLYTVEYEPRHAAFARTEFETAGVGEKVEIIEGAALDVLPALVNRLGSNSVDVLFFDAIKHEYPDYLRLLGPTLRPGGLLLADNALGSGSWWIDGAPGESPERDAVDAFNREISGSPLWDAWMCPLREGVLVARKRRGG